MVHWSAFFFFFALVFFQEKGLLFHPENPQMSYSNNPQPFRLPASVGGSCYDIFRELEVIKDPRSRFHLWKRIAGLPQSRFDEKRFQNFVEDYRSRDSERLFLNVEDSPESLLALTRVVAEKISPDNIPQLKLNRFKEASLERLVRRFKKKGVLETAQIEDLTRELYLTAFGPEIPMGSFLKGKKAQEQAILRIVQQDLLSRGLLKVFKDYRYTQTNPTFLQRFRESKIGRAALTGLFNLPMYLGTPPLYLPGKRPIKLSEELASEILHKGILDEGVTRRLEMELGGRVLTPLRYEIIKSYYVRGIMVYVTLAGVYDFYQLNKELDEEKELIEEATNEAVRILNIAEELDQSGIDIFAEEGVEEGRSFCDALYSCLETLGISKEAYNESPQQYIEELGTCRSLMDPDNRCKSL